MIGKPLAAVVKSFGLNATGTSGVSSITRTRNDIGRSNWSGDQYCQGNMDDVRIYNYCLTDADVLVLYSGR